MFRLLGSTLIFPLLLTGCLYGPEQKTNQAIDPPPKEVEKAYDQAIHSNAQQKQAQKTQKSGMELYFLSDTGHVVPYTLSIPNVQGIAKETLEYMVQGGAGEKMLPNGFTGILPAGTKVLGLNIQKSNKTATVDFSKQFLSYKPEMEEKILSAITWTLTGFPSVEKVNIRVNGRALETMPQKKIVAQNLTRNQGINLEVAEGINISQSIPVTLYFMGQSTDNQTYYVPVTRMINRTDHLAEAAMKELIKGPKQNSGLVSALDSSLKVNQLKLQNRTAQIDFNEQLLHYDNQKQASKDALETIIFTLAENAEIDKVKITVNGKQLNSTQPISRPKYTNPSGL